MPKKEVKAQLGKAAKKLLEKELKQLSNQVSKIERDIEYLERFIEEADRDLMDASKAQSLLSDVEFFSKYQKSKDKLDQQMIAWESCQSKMENLIKKR